MVPMRQITNGLNHPSLFSKYELTLNSFVYISTIYN